MTGRPPDPNRKRVPIVVKDKRVRVDEEQPAEDRVQAESAPDPDPRPAEPDEGLLEAVRLAEDRLDQLKRLKADYENFRRRAIREQTEIVERANRRLVERLLPVLDDFDRALGAARGSVEAESLLRGVELVHRHLSEALTSEGVERVDPEGHPFDPHEHEAMLSQPADVDEPTVGEVVRPGYRLKGKTIRPALVHVLLPREPEPEAEIEPEPESEEGGE